jgi:hypothetical protein
MVKGQLASYVAGKKCRKLTELECKGTWFDILAKYVLRQSVQSHEIVVCTCVAAAGINLVCLYVTNRSIKLNYTLPAIFQ